MTITLFGEESPLFPLLFASIDFFTGERAGDLLPVTSSILSLGMILTSAGLGGGDLSDCLSPK